jgi:hypothetical protein
LVSGQDLLDERGEAIEGRPLDRWLDLALSTGKAPRLDGGERFYRAGEPGSPEAVKPIYVRSPDADMHITKMRDPWADFGAGR